ncbi:mediator complex subunit 13 C-terminal-domain-containing protein [Aspergillus aurantiobrunneus]
MEFPGGSMTNIRVIDGFSNVYWRIYTEEVSDTNPPVDSPNNGHTVLKHISRLKELELRLRSQGSLVLSYPRRLGLLIFSATPDFEHLPPVLLNEREDDSSRLLVGSTVLKVWTSGSVSSGDLAKSHRSDLQTTGANSPAPSQRFQSGSVQPRRVDNSGGSAAIYASFITAVTAAFSLQIVRQNNAIPLGPRTLFNTVESDLNEGQSAVNNGLTSVAALTSIQVQLTSVGKLTISLQTMAQTGLTRFSEPGAGLTEFPPGTDLWLAPTGSIARLVTIYPERNMDSRHFPVAEDASRWKLNVLEWLGYFGLPLDVVTEEGWVEVEVWEPFYSKLSGEAARVREENSSLPLKRILWPAVYCFRRTKSSQTGVSGGTEESPSFHYDPLDFAEEWYTKEIPKTVETDSGFPAQGQEGQVSNQGTSSPGFVNLPEGIESLSRASLYPEMHNASLVYPTPPDGTAGIGVNAGVSSDVFAEDSDNGSSMVQNQTKHKQNIRSTAKTSFDPDVTMEFGPSAGLGVGSGLYDTNEDDDLFGDLNERDFGAQGITDADFSFFDDHDFNHTGKDADIEHVQESPVFTDTGGQSAVVRSSGPVALSPNSVPIGEKPIPQKSPEQITVASPRDQSAPESKELISSSHHDQVQTISPPLSPVEVKKILLPESSVSSRFPAKSTHVPSYYSPVAFKNNISSWDKKYGADGKFSFMGAGTAISQDPSTSSDGIPTIGLPPRRKSNVKTLAYPKAPDGHGSPLNEKESSSSPDSSSETDDESDNSGLENNMPPTTLVMLKRKRARSSPRNSPGPFSEKGLEHEINMLKYEDSIFLGNFLSTFSDWSIAGFFSLSENQTFPSLAPRELQVQIAQLLVDQVTQSSLDHKLDGNFGISCLDNQAFNLRELLDGSEYLGGFEKLDLNSFVSLQEQNVFSPDASSGFTPRQNIQRKETGRGSIARLSPPHLRVRRGKDFLETLPPAVSFWETFGLEPAHGPKDITAYCIHPPITTKAADVFLERLGLLYSSCNLGNHSRGKNFDAFNGGLGEWGANAPGQSNYQIMMQQLKTICEDLGTALINGPSSKDNIVVYIINPFLHAASLVDICAAFWCLLQNYFASADKQQSKQLDEVVLQIIPMDFVASAESLVVPPQTEYLNLAMEVYSRCSTRQIQPSLVNRTPPVMLAETLPPSIGFRLASERSSPLQEGKCLHVACSRSQDQRWMTVAWSDNSGVLQRTMSYCLRFRNSTTSRALASVRSEIWAATRDIMDKTRARWRVIIVNTENVDQDEHDTWLNLAEQYNKSKLLELMILSVNTASDLSLSPPPSPMPTSVLNPQASSTPIATPLPSASILSPDQPGNAPTPPSGANAPANASTPTDILPETESESLLTDVCDESWSVVLSHRLNGTLHLTEYRPALASGYLLRRKSPTDADGAFTMNINLLFTQRPSSSYGSLLREIIGMYRDLATLARVRGTRIVQSGTLPWHIATAVRAQEILSYVL